MLQFLDLFGVHFAFRVGDYENFKTKTGGIFFLIYLFSMIIYFVYGILDYFQNGQNETIYYEESFMKNEINLKDQEVEFGFLDSWSNIKNKQITLKSEYINKEKPINQTEEIKNIKCLKNQTSFSDINPFINDLNFYCFDNKVNNTISAEIRNKRKITYTISEGSNNNFISFFLQLFQLFIL